MEKVILFLKEEEAGNVVVYLCIIIFSAILGAKIYAGLKPGLESAIEKQGGALSE